MLAFSDVSAQILRTIFSVKAQSVPARSTYLFVIRHSNLNSCHLFSLSDHRCDDMITRNMIPTAPQPDTELVDESLSGNRDAFGHIVSRYQSLICSLAYSATGSLSQSEDLAQ